MDVGAHLGPIFCAPLNKRPPTPPISGRFFCGYDRHGVCRPAALGRTGGGPPAPRSLQRARPAPPQGLWHAIVSVHISDRGPHRLHPRCRLALGAGHHRVHPENGARAVCQRFPDPPPRAFRGAPALIFHPPNAEGSTGPTDRRPGVPVSRAQRAGTSAERLLGTLLSTLGLQPRSCFAAPLRRAVADHAASESAASPVWPALPRPA